MLKRNADGCYVLNTGQVMFVDIDRTGEAARAGLAGFLSGLFSGGNKAPAENSVLSEVRAWAQKNSRWGLRLYRTAGGFRLLVTHDLFNPEQVRHESIFQDLKADPLYVALCKNQKSFRARLTPKHWRCDLEPPPSRWPWPDSQAESRFQEWHRKYLASCEKRATCEFIEQIGSQVVHAEVRPIIALHDKLTKSASKLELA